MTAKRRLLFLFASFVFFSACLPFPGQVHIICPKIGHDLMNNAYGQSLWSIQDVYASTSGFGPLLTSTAGRLFVVGDTSAYPGRYLLSYETLTGNLVWYRPVDLPIFLYATDGELYQGQSDKLGVYDSVTGNLLGEFSTQREGIIVSLYQIGDKFYMYTSSGRFVVFDGSAKKFVSITEPNLLKQTLLIKDNITYSHELNKLIAFNGSTGTVVWQVEMNKPFADPIFRDDMIFISTGSSTSNYISGISAINRSTGVIVWKKDLNIIISNVVALNSELYFLTGDGFLIVLDQQTGQEIGRMQFSGTPFLLPDTQPSIGGYYVSADNTHKIIFVTLGDSCQLFAIKLGQE